MNVFIRLCQHRSSLIPVTTDSEVNSVSSGEVQTILKVESLPPRPGMILHFLFLGI